MVHRLIRKFVPEYAKFTPGKHVHGLAVTGTTDRRVNYCYAASIYHAATWFEERARSTRGRRSFARIRTIVNSRGVVGP